MDSDGFGMPEALEQARWMGPKLVFLEHHSINFLETSRNVNYSIARNKSSTARTTKSPKKG